VLHEGAEEPTVDRTYPERGVESEGCHIHGPVLTCFYNVVKSGIDRSRLPRSGRERMNA
jgi:hypothetical protein